MVGLTSTNGETDAYGGQPMRMGWPVVDIATGRNAALGIMFALRERERSGKCQFVEATLYDCGLSLLHPHSTKHLLGPRIVPGRSGNAHPNIFCPYDTFATGSTPIYLAVGNDGQFGKLCELIGAPELSSDPRFVTNLQRNAHRDALKCPLEAKVNQFDCEPLADRLARAGVPCAPIHDVPAALADPHTQHRGMVVEIGDEYRGVASPIKLSRTPATYRVDPPQRNS